MKSLKRTLLFSLILTALFVAVMTIPGCGTEAKKEIVVDNGKGVTLAYSSTDGGSNSAADGKTIDLDVDADGNIQLSYASDTETETVATNDPAAVVEAAGEAAEGVITGGVSDIIDP